MTTLYHTHTSSHIRTYCVKQKEGNVPSIKSLLKKDRELKNKRRGSTTPITTTQTSTSSGPAIVKKDQVEKYVVAKEESSVRQRLLKFYQVYNPAKLDDKQAIDELLRRYQGREQQLFSDLETKYILSAPKTHYVRKKMEIKAPSKTNVILKVRRHLRIHSAKL